MMNTLIIAVLQKTFKGASKGLQSRRMRRPAPQLRTAAQQAAWSCCDTLDSQFSLGRNFENSVYFSKSDIHQRPLLKCLFSGKKVYLIPENNPPFTPLSALPSVHYCFEPSQRLNTATCYKCTARQQPLARIDPRLTQSNVLAPQLQTHSVTPSIDLYPLMFFSCVSNETQARGSSGEGGCD